MVGGGSGVVNFQNASASMVSSDCGDEEARSPGRA